MGDVNHPDTCWCATRSGSFVAQVMEEPMGGDASWDAIPTNKGRPAADMKVRRSLGCSNHDMTEFKGPERKEPGKKQDHSLRLQEGRLWPVQGSAWKNCWYPMALERRAVQG